MAARQTLNATKREIFGKKLGAQRKEGKIPANIYGKALDSVGVFIDEKELKTLLKEINETTLIDIIVGSEKPRPVILRKITHNPVKRIEIKHVDIQQVNLKEKMVISIQVKLIGENELATKGEAIIETITSAVEIEALPTELPEEYGIDISKLTEIGQQIYVKDLPEHKGVEVLTDKEAILVTLVQPQKIEEEVVPVTEEAQIGEITETGDSENTEDKSNDKE